MLVEIVMENFFSFKDEATFSMVASPIGEHPESVYGKNNIAVTKLATIYGANASGKSNLLKAMKMIQEGLLLQKCSSSEWLDHIEPFHLDARTEKKDTMLEVSFLLDGKLYRYGFFVNRKRVTEEFLYLEGDEQKDLFFRNATGQIAGGEWAEMFRDIILDDTRLALSSLLSAPESAEHPELKLFIEWFTEMRIILDTSKIGLSISMAKMHLSKYKHNLLALIQVADPSIQDIVVHELENSRNGRPELAFFVVKTRRNEAGESELHCENFRFQDTESAGTVKLLALAGPIIEVLEKGGLLMVDEMDTQFHTLMTRYVLELFSGDVNDKGAQMIYSTHDITNLSSNLFRRDQVWFVEKDTYSASHLTSLVEYRFDDEERKNSFEFYRNYLNGKYGAIPFPRPLDWWVDNGK